MKKINIFRRLLWQSMLLAVPLLFLIGFAMRPSISEGSQGGYDINESIAKLKAIGKALQIYRAEYGYLPVEQRKNYSDAGLPPSIVVLTWQGFNWSVSPDTFKLSETNGHRYDENALHFREVAGVYYKFVDGQIQGPEGYENQMFAIRGEDLPILADMNVMTPTEIHEAIANGSNLTVVVLRLSGEVEVVQYKANEPLDLLSK